MPPENISEPERFKGIPVSPYLAPDEGRIELMEFSFVQITDHHLLDSHEKLIRGYSPSHAFRSVLRHIGDNHGNVDFVVSTGDLVEHGTDTEYQYLRLLLGLADCSHAPGPQISSAEGLHGMPFYFLPGNHDPREAFFRNMFPLHPNQSSGDSRMNVSFFHKGVQFLCIDWGWKEKGIVTDSILNQLAIALEGGTPSILLSHHPVTPPGVARLDGMVPDEIDQFAAVIRDKNVLAIFSGHVHSSYSGKIAGKSAYGLRSTQYGYAQVGEEWLPVLRPPQYRVIHVSGGSLRTELVDVRI